MRGFFFVAAAVLLLSSTTADIIGRKTVVIGDVHGDLDQLKLILRMSGITNRDGHWIANTTRLVQMGDLIDRGPDDKHVVDYIETLRHQAQTAGSSVVTLLGNHELLNLAGHLHYANPVSNEAFGGPNKRRKAWKSTGHYGQLMRENFVAAHQADRTVYVHAGLRPRHAKPGIAELNRKVRELLTEGQFDHALLNTDGPMWTRLLVIDAMNGKCDELAESLRLLDADRMVVGHTPQRNKRIGSYCEDRLLAVDVGLSKWMLGGLAALEITVLDDGGHEVELREITVDDHAGTRQNSPAEVAEEKDPDVALKEDPDLLQEIHETLMEYQMKSRRDCSSGDKCNL